MRAARVALLVLAGAAASAVGCGDELSLEGRPCPCTGGWQCCEEANICVRKASECTLALTPSAIRLRIAASHRFSVPLIPVTWAVEESNGGSIDYEGLYRAPIRPGTYHVRATAKTGAYAVAVVVVGPSELKRRLGYEGGVGTVDGIGADARFSYPASVAGDGEYLYVTDGPVGDFWTDPCLLEVYNNDCPSTWAHCDAILAKCPIPPSGIRRISLATLSVSRLAQDRFFRHLAVAKGQLFSATSKPWAGCKVAPMADPGCAVQMPLFLSELVRIDPATGAVSPVAGVSTRIDPFYDAHNEDYDPARDGVGDDARFAHIQGLAANGADTLYVADSNALRRVDIETREVTTMAAPYSWPEAGVPIAPFQSLSTLTAHEGNIYGLDSKGGTVWKYDPGTLAFSKHLSWSLPQVGGWLLASPGLCVDRGELVGVVGRCVQPLTSSAACDPPMLSATGSGPATPKGFGLPIPNGLWCNGTGTWYAADSMGPSVLQISGEAREILAGAPAHETLHSPSAISANASGELVFYEKGTGQLVSVGPTSQVTGHYDCFTPLTFGPDRLVYHGTGTIYRLDLQTGESSFLAKLLNVSSLVHDGVDTLYASACSSADSVGGEIVRIDSSGSITSVAKGYCGELALGGPAELFLAKRGSYSTEYAEELLAIDLESGNARKLVTPSDGWKATSLAYDPAGLLYVVEAPRHRIRGLIVETGEVLDLVGSSAAQGVKVGPLPGGLNRPGGIALLPSGALAITDVSENVVLVAE